MTTSTQAVAPAARPLHEAYVAADAALADAHKARQAAGDGADAAALDEACTAADVARDAAFALWRDSDEERTYNTADRYGYLDVDCAPSVVLTQVKAVWLAAFEGETYDEDGDNDCRVVITCDDGFKAELAFQIPAPR